MPNRFSGGFLRDNSGALVIAGGVGAQTDLARLGGFAPTGAIAENMPRTSLASGTFVPVTSGTLLAFKGPVLPAGSTVSTITILSAGTGYTTLTHSWAALLDMNLNVLAKTADLTTAWNANSGRTFTFSTPYSVTADMAVYAGLVVVFVSGGSLVCAASLGGHTNGTSGTNPVSPILVGNSTAALNVPGDLGATAAALTAPAAANIPYCYVA